MLIEFKVANFRSFREEQTLSLVASKDTTHPGNLIDCGNFHLLKAAAVYGANASGKSNLVAAVDFMETFVSTSATKLNLGDPIEGMSPFRLDAEHAGQPSRFEATVLIDGARYVYGFSATAERVHDEWLKVCRPGGRLVSWVERGFDAASGQTHWEIRGPLRKDAELLREKTRQNGLVLSRGAELNMASLNDLFLWFRKELWVYDLSDWPGGLIQRTARRVKDDAEFRARVLNLLQDADLGIRGIDVSEMRQLLLFPELAGKETATQLAVATLHHLHHSDKSVSFDLETDESNGTQRLFALAGPVLDVLENGAVLVLDEFDCSMHPLLVRKLIELFQSPSANAKGAQLVFATHDSTLMDSALFRRDQVWLTEKNSAGATEMFSLYDFDRARRPRVGEALAKNYLAGRYGGVPDFGPTFQDFEIK